MLNIGWQVQPANPDKNPSWLYLFGVILIGIAIISGFIINPISSENLRSFLSTLAGIQGGVIALVLSVLVLGVQFISWLSSPWIASMLIHAKIFHTTILLFLLSLAVNMCLLFFIPPNPSQIFTILVIVSAAVTLLGFSSLYSLSVFVFHQSTPESAVSTYKEMLSPSRFASLAQDDSAPHPLYPLFIAISSAISKKDRHTTVHGISVFSELLLSALTARQKDGKLASPDPDSVYGDYDYDYLLFGIPLQEYIPMLALEAFDQDENDIGESLLVVNVKIFEKIVEKEEIYSNISPHLPRRAIFGLADFAQRTPPTKSGAIGFELAMNGIGRTLNSSYPKALGSQGGMHYIPKAAGEVFLSGRGTERHIRAIVNLQERIIDQQNHILRALTGETGSIDWWRCEFKSGDVDERKSNLLFSLRMNRVILVELTGALISSRKRSEDELSLYTSEELSGVWTQACRSAMFANSPRYAKTLLVIMIEAAFAFSWHLHRENISENLEEYTIENYEAEEFKFISPWIGNISSISQEHPQLVESAFDEILETISESKDAEHPDPFHFGFQSDVWTDSMISAEPVLNWLDEASVREFYTWIPSFQSAVASVRSHLEQEE